MITKLQELRHRLLQYAAMTSSLKCADDLRWAADVIATAPNFTLPEPKQADPIATLIERLKAGMYDVPPSTAALMQEAIDALAAPPDKDGERYRWLCDGNGYFMEEEGICGHYNEKDKADAAIDAAIAQGVKNVSKPPDNAALAAAIERVQNEVDLHPNDDPTISGRWCQFTDDLRTLLAAARQGEPVPREPTAAMQEAGRAAMFTEGGHDLKRRELFLIVRKGWRAMYDAAIAQGLKNV